MAVNVTTAFAGTNVSAILSLLVLGFESVQKGLIHTIPNKYDVIYMPSINVAENQIQARVPTPDAPSDATYLERVITPLDMMAYLEFNPATFEHVWQDFWPKGPMVNQVQDPKIQAAVLKSLRGSVNTQMDLLAWQGDTTLTGTPLVFMNGYLKQMKADADVIDVPFGAAIDAATIQDDLDLMISAMPAAVRVNKKPKFIMSHASFDAFEQYTTSIDYKGNDVYNATTPRYRGYDIVSVGGMTDADIVFVDATTGPEGNLFAGTWLANDRENFKVARLQENSELWFMKALWRYGVNYGKGSEIVLGNYTTP